MQPMILATLFVMMAAPVWAQTPPSTPPPGQPPTRPALTPPPAAQTAQGNPAHINVRLDLVITDTYTETPAKKTVSMIVANDRQGMIRTSNRLPNQSVGLNVDASVLRLTADLVRVGVTFEYTPARASDGALASPPELHESLVVILKDGQPLIVSQSADPATDRRVTVELTATILK
jgi:hypothetical protein